MTNPNELVPICHDNADYYCMTPDGRMIFWSHDVQGPNGEEWPTLAAWIEAVWMHGSDAGWQGDPLDPAGVTVSRSITCWPPRRQVKDVRALGAVV